METYRTTNERPMPKLTKAMMSEAGAWMARLNGPYRTPRVEQGFQQWLKDHPAHREAFRLVSVDWEGMEELRRFANVSITAPNNAAAVMPQRKVLRVSPWLAAAAVITLTVVSGLLYYWQADALTTGVGEQRILTLEDGTKVSLNTATRIFVQYDRSQRRVRLDSGEALFDVAKQAERPFIVDLGDHDVTALGTAFLVRRDDKRTAVTLIEGKVSISPGKPASPDTGAPADTVLLIPGERLTFTTPHEAPEVDRPVMDKLTAWQQGKVAIDKMRLSEAVEEMNRYSPIRLTIERPETERLLISGVFTAGQSSSFARAVAQSYGLQVIERGDTIQLAGQPTVPE